MEKDIKKSWDNATHLELGFWDRWFATKGLSWKDEYNMKVDPHSKLQEHFLPYIDKSMEKIKILDVGAGPLTYINKNCDFCELEIHACDALADQYNAIIEKYHVRPPVKTEQLDMIELTKRYPKNTFDISHARNCIDHSYDPVKCIEEMMHVTKKQGFIILHHVFKEGTRTGWPGLHLWDIFYEGRSVFIQNKTSKKCDITEIFKDNMCLVDVREEKGKQKDEEDMFLAVWQKT